MKTAYSPPLSGEAEGRSGAGGGVLTSFFQALLVIIGKRRKKMKDFRGETNSEDKLIRATQRAIGALDNGWVGAQTMSDLAVAVGADGCWPCTLRLYDMPVIIAEDIVAANPKKGCASFANSMSGGFSYNAAPCSILVDRGNILGSVACHAWLGNPETVLYRTEDGRFGLTRAKSVSDLPKNIRWAVGGMGLMNMYDPDKEGFSGKYADVLRITNHTLIGVKNGKVYLVYCKTMSGNQVNNFVSEKLKLDMAIMLDGGHVAAMNGAEPFSKINMWQTQYSLLQGV